MSPLSLSEQSSLIVIIKNSIYSLSSSKSKSLQSFAYQNLRCHNHHSLSFPTPLRTGTHWQLWSTRCRHPSRTTRPTTEQQKYLQVIFSFILIRCWFVVYVCIWWQRWRELDFKAASPVFWTSCQSQYQYWFLSFWTQVLWFWIEPRCSGQLQVHLWLQPQRFWGENLPWKWSLGPTNAYFLCER